MAKNQKIVRLHQEETLHSDVEHNETRTGLNAVATDMDRNTGPAAEPEPEQSETTQFPKTRSGGSFLTHSALSPAQRQYLHTVSASFSSAHVHGLILQHYRNALLRWKPTGFNLSTEDQPVTSSENHSEKPAPNRQPDISSTEVKKRNRKTSGARNSGKSSISKLHTKTVGSGKTSASKQRKTKKSLAPPTPTGQSLKKSRIRQTDEETENEEDGDDFLNECLSSLSVTEWDDDTFSDL